MERSRIGVKSKDVTDFVEVMGVSVGTLELKIANGSGLEWALEFQLKRFVVGIG